MMKSALNSRFSLATLVLATLLLSACGKKDDAGATAPAAQKIVYTVGTNAAYRPMEWQDQQKNIVGFDIDLMKAIAQKEGLELRFVDTPFESIFNALAQGDRDILISSITVTDERRKTVDFSEPYFEARQLIAVPKQRSDIKKFDDLKNLKIGVQSSTTGDLLAQQLVGKNNTNVKRMEDIPLVFSELEAGGVDAVVTDEPVIRNYIAHNGSEKFKTISDAGFPKEYYGIAVRKGNADLLKKINQGLAAIKQDGTYEQISERYFGKAAQ